MQTTFLSARFIIADLLVSLEAEALDVHVFSNGKGDPMLTYIQPKEET